MLFPLNLNQRYILSILVPIIFIAITVSIFNYYAPLLIQYRYFIIWIIILSLIILFYELLLFNTNAKNLIVNGDESLKSMKYDLAIKFFNKVIQYKKDSSTAYIGRGIAFFKKKRYDKAMANFKMVKGAGSYMYDLYYYRGLLGLRTYQSLEPEKRDRKNYLGQEILQVAISDFTDAIKINNFKGNLFFLRGLSYFYKGIFSAAVGDFSKGITLNPAIQESYVYRGLANCEIGELDQAWQDLQQVRNSGIQGNQKLSESLSEAYFNRGLYYYRERKLSEAQKDLNKAKGLGNKRVAAAVEKITFHESFIKTTEDYRHPEKLTALEGLEKLAKEFESQRDLIPDANKDVLIETVDYIKSQINTTRETLEDFINTIEARQENAVSDPEAEKLIAKARMIISRLANK